MPHRGRLNVLCNILKKPPGALYGEMEGGQSEFHVGDVKYHLGQSASLEYANEVAACAACCQCALACGHELWQLLCVYKHDCVHSLQQGIRLVPWHLYLQQPNAKYISLHASLCIAYRAAHGNRTWCTPAFSQQAASLPPSGSMPYCELQHRSLAARLRLYCQPIKASPNQSIPLKFVQPETRHVEQHRPECLLVHIKSS